MLQQMSVLRRKAADTATHASLWPISVGAPSSSVLELLSGRQALLPHETEDTVLTGGGRSLNRRLLALNIEGTLVRRHAVPQHSAQYFDPLGRSA